MTTPRDPILPQPGSQREDPAAEPKEPYPGPSHDELGDAGHLETAAREIPTGDIHSHDYGRHLRPRFAYAGAMMLTAAGLTLVAGLLVFWIALGPFDWPGVVTGLPLAGLFAAALGLLVARKAWPRRHAHASVRVAAGIGVGLLVLLVYSVIGITLGMTLA